MANSATKSYWGFEIWAKIGARRGRIGRPNYKVNRKRIFVCVATAQNSFWLNIPKLDPIEGMPFACILMSLLFACFAGLTRGCQGVRLARWHLGARTAQVHQTCRNAGPREPHNNSRGTLDIGRCLRTASDSLYSDALVNRYLLATLGV